jgi:O-antigen ligase/polysaccharide polymerase Wzy-like membrane protein
MLSSFKKPYFNSHNLYLFGAISICVGLSLSKPLLGLGQLLISVAWIVDGNLKNKIKAFFTNPLAIALIAFFGLTLIGLINTSEFGYAFKDIKRKLPLFVIPFVLFSKKFTAKELKLFFIIYIGGVLSSSFWSVFVKLGGLGITIHDYRDLSRFNSHIRFGLEICLAIFGAGYYFFKTPNAKEKIVWLLTIVWLSIFMVFISLFTGIAILFVVTVLMILFFSFKLKLKPLKIALFLSPILILAFGGYKLEKSYSSFYENNKPLKELEKTANGQFYFHDSTATNKENGYYTFRNNCFGEMFWEWEKKSTLPFHGNDLKGQKLKITLTRFLTSKGVYKDSLSVYNLTPKEINAIENGIANYKLVNMSSIDKRLFDIIWEFDNYKNGGDINGHSILMRLEYWKTGLEIFIDNQILGVGSGDIQAAFNDQYEINNSILKPQYRLRAHNQFITILATFGLIGIIIFGWFLFFPMIKTKANNCFLYLAFFLIILVSMITEDTLDTQVGITFYAFFNTLLILNNKALEES